MRSLILTVGGVCPGQNSMIKHITRNAKSEVLGGLFGFGCIDKGLLKLDPHTVERLDQFGGTMIGTSKHYSHPFKFIEFLHNEDIDCVYVCGDRKAARATQTLHECGSDISFLSLPFSMDNTFSNIDVSVGFQSIVEYYKNILNILKDEASSLFRGVSVLYVSKNVAPFLNADIHVDKENPMDHIKLEWIVEKQGYACITVSEVDIKIDMTYNVKVSKPGYMARGIAANKEDSSLCEKLAIHAISGGQQNLSGTVVGTQNGVVRFVPIKEVLQ